MSTIYSSFRRSWQGVFLYSKVVYLGNCMGATAALRFSSLLQHESDFVLAFNPEVAPPVIHVAHSVLPHATIETSRLRAVLETAVMKTPAKIRIHVQLATRASQAMLFLAPPADPILYKNSWEEDMFDVDFDTVANSSVALPVSSEYCIASATTMGSRQRLKENGALSKDSEKVMKKKKVTLISLKDCRFADREFFNFEESKESKDTD